MKKLLLALLVLFTISVHAQVPQAFSYQGVAFDAEGAPLSDASINVEIKIIRDSAQGTTVYTEQHNSTTNAAGLYNLNIGQGTNPQGEFENIDWSALPLFISVGLDADGSGTFQSVGTSQLLSVPYALRAGAAEVEPIIFVDAFPSFVEPGGPVARVSNRNNSQFTGIGSLQIYYDWVQGTPEDVFVEVKGLPNNISLFATSVAGFAHSSFGNRESIDGLDTIFYGQLERRLALGRHDVNIDAPNGLYPLDIVYSIKDRVLDSIQYNLKVITNFYDECLPSLPFSKNITTNECTEIASNISSEIIFTEFSEQVANFTLPIGDDLGDILYFFPDDCTTTSISADAFETFGDFNAQIRNVFMNGTQFDFDIEIRNNITNEESVCRITYQ